MITRFSIVTLIIFILSIFFVIHPISFGLTLPRLGRRRVHINLTTAPIVAIAVLWASQCLGATQVCLNPVTFKLGFNTAQIRNGIVGTGQSSRTGLTNLF